MVTPCVGVWIETAYEDVVGISGDVTPCVGVWIETTLWVNMVQSISVSHPAWVCGLKQAVRKGASGDAVTPCVGVWIET